jgi:hypothetical protein
MGLIEQFLELVSVFKQKLHITFSLELRQAKNLKTISVWTKRTDFIE